MRFSRFLFFALLSSLALPAIAAGASSKDPDYWLQRMGPALAKTSYQGVFVYVRGDQVSSIQIAHRFENGQVEERLVMQDGKAGEIVRKGMNVVCVLPEQGRLELNHVMPSGPFAGAYSRQLAPVGRFYRPEFAGDDRIAGHEVVRLMLNATDSLRYSHQLWLEKSTGLPIKGKVLSGSGEVLEYFHFTSLTLNDSLPDQAFRIQSEGREVTRTLLPPASSDPDAGPTNNNGWALGWKPPGFQPVAATVPGSENAVAFSDGLASFSVFVEPASGIEMPSGSSKIGATTVYMQKLERKSQDFLVTVVGEVPLETALRVAQSVTIEDSGVLGSTQP
jgi:sigma-E factor negative regulatory protein RseB